MAWAVGKYEVPGILLWFRLCDVDPTERQSDRCVYFLGGSKKLQGYAWQKDTYQQ